MTMLKEELATSITWFQRVSLSAHGGQCMMLPCWIILKKTKSALLFPDDELGFLRLDSYLIL